ncbi:MAG: NAD-dependent epimerase/dehydratase family protein [Gammaproteobacteria bacterium]|nr:NAD-dependent epimerase/dehydratase family protein [Gammaproteobacteria bacterium]
MTENLQPVNDKPVLVAGASGFVGSHTARELVRQGRTVRVLLRKSSDKQALENLPVQIVYGDVLEPESLLVAMQGCGSVFYSVVDPRFWLTDPGPIYRNNVDGLVNAMDAALTCGIERFIFTSTMGTLGINPDGPVTEEIEFNWYDRASPYIRARLQAEKVFLQCCREKGLPGVALCVANTYGPEDYQPTPHGKMLWDVARGEARFTIDAGAPTVDIRDVANAALLAEKYGRAGERYIISNEFISNRDFYNMAAAEGGSKLVHVVPRSLAYGIAWIAERLLKLFGQKDYLISTDAVFLSNVFQEMDNRKARTELRWNPRPIRETVRDAVAWYAQRENTKSAR